MTELRSVLTICFLTFFCYISESDSQTSEFLGYVSAEARFFNQNSLFPQQQDSNFSLSGELEFYTSWANDQQSLIFKPFFRIDENDNERSHVDVHELLWVTNKEKYSLKAGLGKVFWGATEFYHLVDIINQTDAVESIDGESKLGQPMLSLSVMRSWGELELFLLPGFRERTFPGDDARLQIVPQLDVNDPIYESGQEDRHIDWAARWATTLDNIDIGVGYFKGTSRDPEFVTDQLPSGQLRIRPFYAQIEQFSLDIQALYGNNLWKLESLYRSGLAKSYFAATGGFEYSFIGMFNSRADLGLVIEYMYDERGEDANHFLQDDLGVGLRFVFNDTQSTEILFGLIMDQQSNAKVWSLESSRRLGDNWKIMIEGYVFQDIDDGDILSGIRHDDYLGIEIIRYF